LSSAGCCRLSSPAVHLHSHQSTTTP